MEKSLKFTDFQAKLKRDLKESGNRLSAGPAFEDPGQLPALILAYIGDAVFSLHVRTAMLSVEPNKVQILHTLLAPKEYGVLGRCRDFLNVIKKRIK